MPSLRATSSVDPSATEAQAPCGSATELPSWRLLEGDCVEALAAMPEASVDAVVCDPPYGLEFMGREWDTFKLPDSKLRTRVDGRTNGAAKSVVTTPESYRAGRPFQEWCEAWAREALRVLKPGGHLVAFGGTRTYHRLVSGLEDAGFEIRDQLGWLFGSGFPKSLDVSKAIDKAAGAEREEGAPGPYASRRPREESCAVNAYHDGVGDAASALVTTPVTEDAKRWQGFGTALKPAHEPIVLARKPLTGTVAATVLEHGTGALNIDACRIGGEERPVMVRTETVVEAKSMAGESTGATSSGEVTTLGRWPANVALDPEAAALLDAQSGDVGQQGAVTGTEPSSKTDAIFGDFGARAPAPLRGDSGGASRFFYVAKPDNAERHAGLGEGAGLFAPTDVPDRNDHPTVKPVDLMRWLVRLVTPPGGTVLDPFTGSGTTGAAALLEGRSFIGVEREAAYLKIARARIAHFAPGSLELSEEAA